MAQVPAYPDVSEVKTTLVLDDDLDRQAKVIASGRGCTVSSLVEDALEADRSH